MQKEQLTDVLETIDLTVGESELNEHSNQLEKSIPEIISIKEMRKYLGKTK